MYLTTLDSLLSSLLFWGPPLGEPVSPPKSWSVGVLAVQSHTFYSIPSISLPMELKKINAFLSTSFDAFKMVWFTTWQRLHSTYKLEVPQVLLNQRPKAGPRTCTGPHIKRLGTGLGPALLQMDPGGKSLYLTINIMRYQSNVILQSL